jgi:putative ABC transport system permease protein
LIWSTAFSLALRSLWRNKVRAMLTALGIIIGVGSVIAMLAVGAGAQQRIASQMEGMGSFSLTIRPGSTAHGGLRGGTGTITNLTLADAEAIAMLPNVIAAAPSVHGNAQVRYRGSNWNTSLQGVTPDYLDVRNWKVSLGRFFTMRQVLGADHVCVLGQTVAHELFGLTNPVGETIIFKGIACRVVGLLAEKGANAWGGDQDDTIMAPLTTIQRKVLGIPHIDRIAVQTAGPEAASAASREIKALLRERHRLQVDQGDDFRIFNRAELAQTAAESASVFTWLLGSIASVSLLVGGIGIMNIMLVSVTERTREIGIRMALGARRRDILWQFLLEALVLSGAGGLLGVLFGIATALTLGELSQFQIDITPWSVMLAFSFAAVIGVFFGLHPARKASRLQPIEALRYE